MIGTKVLLIDGDADFLASAVRTFEQSGAETITAVDGPDGIGKLFTHDPDLVILDMLLAGLDGFQVCQRIRQFSNTPLIMLSARVEEQHMLRGLQAGADDVLSKSVTPAVLLARAQAVIRRTRQTRGNGTGHAYHDGHLVINFLTHSARVGGRKVKLTMIEFRLLTFLMHNADRVLSFEEILWNVWGRKDCVKVDYVHVYISNLRGKIEPDPKTPRYIRTVFGVGYLFEKQN